MCVRHTVKYVLLPGDAPKYVWRPGSVSLDNAPHDPNWIRRIDGLREELEGDKKVKGGKRRAKRRGGKGGEG